MIRGIDVSDWQPDIDWSAVAGAGYSFAIVKATQGTGNVQYVLDPYRRQAPAAGIGPFGMYHFAQDGDATAQADHFCDVVGTLGPDEFAVLDIEHNTSFFTLPEGQWPAFIVAWCERVESRLGGPVVVYMSESPARSMPDSVGRWPLWVAGYQTRTPTAWDDWRVGPWSPSIWQHTSTAHVPGVGGYCDANIAPDDLRARLGFSTSPDPTPTPIPNPPEEPDVSKVAYPLSVLSGETRRLPILAIGGGFGWARASVTYAADNVEVRRAIVGPNERPIAGLAPEGPETGRTFTGRGYVDLQPGDEWLAIELGSAPIGTLDLYVEASDG